MSVMRGNSDESGNPNEVDMLLSKMTSFFAGTTSSTVAKTVRQANLAKCCYNCFKKILVNEEGMASLSSSSSIVVVESKSFCSDNCVSAYTKSTSVIDVLNE